MPISFNSNYEVLSTNNSSTANLAAAATFTGVADAVSEVDVLNISFFATQNCTLFVEQSTNGTNWDISDSFSTTANVGFSTTIASVTAFFRVRVTNLGGSATTSLRLSTQFSAGLSALPRKTGQATAANSVPVSIASDQSALPVTGTFFPATQPVSAASLPLPTGASTSALQTTGNTSLSSIDTKTPPLGQTTMAASTPVTIASNQSALPVTGTFFQATQPVSVVSLPLPTGAATSALQTTGNTALSSIDTKTPPLGQTTMASSTPVVLASNQSAIPVTQGTSPWVVSGTVTVGNASVSITGTAPPGSATYVGGSVTTVAPSYTTGQMSALSLNTAGGLRVDGSGVTQPINAVSLPLPTGAATETTIGTRLADATFTSRINTQGQKTMALSTPVTLASDQSTLNVNVLSTPSPSPEASGFGFGQVTLASTTEVILRKATYTEQTTNAQRSIRSSSANDSAAGTGIRTVQITYYTSTGTGPFSETLTLNGTTGVNTVATDICYIEKMTALTVGSGGVAAGNVTMQSALAGGGVVIKQISTGDLQSLDAVIYIPSGLTLYVTGLSTGHNGTTVGSGARYRIRRQTINAANAPLIQVSDFVRLYGQSSTNTRLYQAPIIIVGPAKAELWVAPETTSSTLYYGAFDYFTRAT